MRRRTFLAASLAAAAEPSLAAAQTSAPGPQAPEAALIEPANALEHAFLAATDEGAGDAQRAVFRRLFLESRIVLVLAGPGANAAPAQISLPTGMRACLVFTSAARAAQAMQREAQLATLTGRQALERVRGTGVIVNINLRPRLVLDAEGVEGFLAIPAANGAAPSPQVAPGVAAPPR